MDYSNTDSMRLEESHAEPKDLAQIRQTGDKSRRDLDFSAIQRVNRSRADTGGEAPASWRHKTWT